MTMQYSINSPHLTLDTSLTNFEVSSQNYLVYAVIRHDFINTTLNQNFILNVNLQGTYNNSFSAFSTIRINVIPDLIIGSPNAKQPVINEVLHLIF
jgi:hypothetical protein